MVRLACSWNLPAGRDAVIEASFHGTRAGAALCNVEGSFTDFTAELTTGAAHRRALATPPDAWSGRAAAAWALEVSRRPRFSPAAEEYLVTAKVLDAIYAGDRPSEIAG